MTRPAVKRDWTDARAKVEAEGVCRYCRRPPGDGRTVEAAHVMGRTHDEPRACEACEGTGHDHEHAPCAVCNGHGYVLWVNPLSIVPLCGPNANQRSCHYRYDHGDLDLLGSLRHEEQVQAVKDAGMPGTNSGIVQAYLRLTNTRDMPVAPVADTASVPEW